MHVVEIRWISCRGDDAVAFALYRREPYEPTVTALAVVSDREVGEHRMGEIEAGTPLPPVKEFDLRP